MKKTILLTLFSVFFFVGCGNQTIASYNDTMVEAHANLFKITDDFFNSCKPLIGNPKSKPELLKLIKETEEKIADAKKPVVELIPFDDHGFRDAVLNMFSNSETSMNAFRINANIITAKNSEPQAMLLFLEQYQKLVDSDKEIREIQTRYAYYNNTEIR